MTGRVLVVDDGDAMRALLCRVLTAAGYAVDAAATLAEARRLDPAGYAAVLVDARLGAERGTDLIEELRSADPAAAARCLLITGDGAATRPDGIAVLAKPFQPAELLDAVHGLGHGGPARRPGHRAGTQLPVRMQPPVSPPPDVTGLAAAGSPGWRLLALVRRLRAQERRELVDFLHDGPIQELTAAALETHQMRRAGAAASAQHFDAMLRQLDAAADSLRWLIDGDGPFCQPETSLPELLRQRTAWLLGEPLTVDAGAATGLAASDVSAVADLVELMLHGMITDGRPVRGRVVVHAEPLSGSAGPSAAAPAKGDRLIRLDLVLTPAGQDGQPVGDPAQARVALQELAAALGATADLKCGARSWRATFEVRTGCFARVR